MFVLQFIFSDFSVLEFTIQIVLAINYQYNVYEILFQRQNYIFAIVNSLLSLFITKAKKTRFLKEMLFF